MGSTSVIFIESYTAGGLDRVITNVVNNIDDLDIVLFINNGCEKSIFKTIRKRKRLRIKYYSIWTVPVLFSRLSKLQMKDSMSKLVKLLLNILKYPLFVFGVFKFYLMMRNLQASSFLAVNGGYPGGDMCRAATISAKFANIENIFHSYHSMPIVSPAYVGWIENFIDHYLDGNSKFISVSNTSGNELSVTRNISQTPLTIYNGVGSKPIKAYKDTGVFNVLNVGYFDEIKNQIAIVRAIKNIVDEHNCNIKLTLVGDVIRQDIYCVLEEYIKCNGLCNYVEIKAFKSNIFEEYYENDILVISSIREGLPMVMLEAMSVGTPVIATDVGGIAEVISHNEDGLIVPVNDVDRLYISLTELCNNRGKVISMGNRAYKKVQNHFTIQKMVEEYRKYL